MYAGKLRLPCLEDVILYLDNVRFFMFSGPRKVPESAFVKKPHFVG